MNKDDFDIFRHFRRDQKNSVGLDFVKGLEDRKYGHFKKKNVKAKENIEVFAEEELVRKNDYDEMRCEMPGLPRSTFLMVFSPDGSKAASTHGNHNIYVTDLRSGKNIKTLVGHPRTPWCIAFHPTSNQIVASGCLGGQVRIWDLSGGSEVWTASSQSVIASIAFHPNDRVLVIATYNEVYFWDWSKPEPFVHVATSNYREKVRYVAFDKLGHKLITGIANGPQTRWERVRAPVPVPRQAERCASPYRRRITPRLVNLQPTQQQPQQPSQQSSTSETNNREPLSSVPERERRITVCYRNLVREYEQLVQRYLQLYRPPTMIDRGTDPMEPNPTSTTSGTQTPEPAPNLSRPSTSGIRPRTSEPTPGPSTSFQNSEVPPASTSQQNVITPSRIFSVIKKPTTLIRGTQTPAASRKHKTDSDSQDSMREKRFKMFEKIQNATVSTSESPGTSQQQSISGERSSPSQSQTEMGTQTQSPRKVLVINSPAKLESKPSTSSTVKEPQPCTSSGFQIRCPKREERSNSQQGSSGSPDPNGINNRNCNQSNVDELLSNIRRTAEEEVRSRILPIIRSVPANDRPELIRLFENSREHVRKRFRQMCPIFLKKPNRRPLLIDTSSDSTSSEDERSAMPTVRLPRRNSEPGTANSPPILNSATLDSSNRGSCSNNPSNTPSTSSGTNMVRNFNTELEQLVTTLLTEIERNETDNRSVSSSVNTTNLNTVTTQTATSENMMNSSSSNVVSSPSPTIRFGDRQLPSSSTFRTATPTAAELALLESVSSSTNTQPLTSSTNSTSNSLLFTEMLQNLERDDPCSSSSLSSTPTSSDTPSGTSNIVNTNTRTTNSTIYTSNSLPRRRFFSHRASAFMPTRVNTRMPVRLRRNLHHIWGRGRLGSRYSNNNCGTFALDELINYSERANSEDDPPAPEQFMEFHPFDPPPEVPSINPENIGIGNMYSNIVQDLESSLIDVRNIRASNRPGETSDMLSSFSVRLENIMNQSDTILRNLRNSMELLTNSAEQTTNERPVTEPTWSFSDQNFYIRDQRTDNPPSALPSVRETLEMIFNPSSSNSNNSAVASDHTYPRNPASPSPSAPSSSDNMSPLMTSLHLTISHIQRQARLLRQQVESIERIDRAMLEVAQLQVMRRIIVELVRYVRTLTGEARSTGMSSVRQMMAGTRISDSSPYDSPTDEQNASANANPNPTSNDVPSTSNTNNPPVNEQPTPPTQTTTGRPRGSNRKTYPPSRFFRLQRQCRRPSIVHFFSRRYLNRAERGVRQNIHNRASTRTASESSSNLRNQPLSNYSIINSSTLSLMARRLEQLLTEQMGSFTRQQEPNTQHNNNNRFTASTDLGEHILALRLHGSVARMNRILSNSTQFNGNTIRADSTTAVTQDGSARYGSRHTLSLIVDGMSTHMEELGNATISQTTWIQMHSVLAMALLLSEVLLLQVVDSIPPPTGMNLDPERESLTTRIDQMCGQMLQSRFSGHSYQLTRSLRLMRLTMRHAYRALGQTYNERRNAMLPYRYSDRRYWLGSIDRCLRSITLRRRNAPTPTTTSSGAGETTSAPNNSEDNTARTSPTTNHPTNREWFATLSDLLRRYSAQISNEPLPTTTTPNPPNTSSAAAPNPNRDDPPPSQRIDNNSSNNSDENDDESEWYGNNNSTSHNSNLYRTNNVTLVHPTTSSESQPRLWNVPSVQVNDVPVSEPSLFHQRIMQRQRFAERLSEMRSNPTIGLFRPRFLHPLYASVNPFDADLDDPQREQIYESDMVTTVTPNHRIQAWDISNWSVPVISNSLQNVVVAECKIHNDASVDVAKDGTILVTLLPSGGYLNVTNRLGVYSLRWETLGQCLYTTSFEQNAVSVSLSPLSRHLVVGLASRRVSIVPSDRWIMARIFKIEKKDVPGDRLPVLRELEQNRDSRINCIRWLPTSGQGLIYATNTGQLIILT